MLQNVALCKADESRWRALRGRAMGMVFQEPMTALNPVMRCGEQIDEVLRCHTDWQATTRREAVLDIMRQVRLPEPERMLDSYPHQLSGGQRQRIVIAMALAGDPELIVADEPTGDLDRQTGEEILVLLDELHRDLGKTIVMVTHDPKAAEYATHTVHLDKGLLVDAVAAH